MSNHNGSSHEPQAVVHDLVISKKALNVGFVPFFVLLFLVKLTKQRKNLLSFSGKMLAKCGFFMQKINKQYSWFFCKTKNAMNCTNGDKLNLKVTLLINWVDKGQTKSKWFFQANISSKKTNEQIPLYYHDTPGWLVFVCFFGRNWRHQKDILKLTAFNNHNWFKVKNTDAQNYCGQ